MAAHPSKQNNSAEKFLTDYLCDKFSEGARSVGHDVEKIFPAKKIGALKSLRRFVFPKKIFYQM